MTAVIIDKRDVDIIAKELLKEIFDYFNNEEAIEDYREKERLEKTRKDFFHNICLNYIFHLRIKNNFKCERIDRKIVYKIILKESYDLNILNEAMKDNAIDTKCIYNIVKYIKVLSDNLNSKINAFKKFYEILVEDYVWLE